MPADDATRLAAERRARVLVDAQLTAAGSPVQDRGSPGKPRAERVEAERFHLFTYDELIARDKADLDITWLCDESVEDLDNLPAPEVVAREIVEDLTAALAGFEAVAAALEATTTETE